MGAILPIMMVAQTAAKVAATNREAHQMRDLYNDKAKLQENEAAVKKVQASQAADKAAAEEKKIINKARAAAASNNAAAGANGVLAEGSLLDINNASNDEAIYDLKQSVQNQRINTQNYRNAESYALVNADRYRTAGRNVIHQAHAQNAATILGTAANLFSMYGGMGSNKTSDVGWSYDGASKGLNSWGLNPTQNRTADINNWNYGGISTRKGYTSYSW